MKAMDRSKAAALLGLLTLAATFGATAVCGVLWCGDHAAPAACHSPDPASTRLTDCCAHSSSATQLALALDALSFVRVATLIATPDVVEPEAAPPLSIERANAHSAGVPLFTLHQSLLL